MHSDQHTELWDGSTIRIGQKQGGVFIKKSVEKQKKSSYAALRLLDD